jgi:LmbE family N-acetylglucosaminyl deacetylase
MTDEAEDQPVQRDQPDQPAQREQPEQREPQLRPMPDDWQRCLAIVAHPDDLEYGVAGAIAAWTAAGRDVAYLLVTRGEAGIAGMSPDEARVVREREQRASAAVVGVTTVEFLDHRDGMIEQSLALRRDISRAIRRHRPELLVTLNHHDSWGGTSWNTADHRAVGRAVLDARGDAGNEWIFPELVAEGFQPWAGVRWVAVASSPHATHAVDATGLLEKAVASLAEHSAYIRALSDEDPTEYARKHLTAYAESVAPRFGGRPALSFEVFGDTGD